MDWIEVKHDTMPRPYDTCIISIALNYLGKPIERAVDVAVYKPDEGHLDRNWDTWNDWDEGQQRIKITHWMPLPEPA